MSDLDKYQQKIDRYVQNNNYKEAINYVTQLKQQGISPENINLLQVYISKNMDSTTMSKSQLDTSKKTIKPQSNDDIPSPQKNNKHFFNANLNYLSASQPYLVDGSLNSVNSMTMLNNVSKQTIIQKSNQNSMIFQKLEEQLNENEYGLKQNSSQQQSQLFDKDNNNIKVKSQLQLKPEGSVVKLPSLNNIDNEQYKYLQSVVKDSLKDLSGKINQKYFKSNAYLDQANYYNSKKDFDKAIEYYDQAMEVDTNNVKILMGKGDCLRKQGLYDEALECYQYALKLNPPHKLQFKILFNLANVYKCQGKNREAIETYSKATLLEPSNPNTYFNKALTFYSLGELDDAIDHYSKVIKNNPKDQHAFLNKGMALREIGEFGTAVECFTKASSMKARNARQYLNKGNALFQIDKLEESLVCFQRAIQMESNFYEAYLNMGVVLNELGRTNEELQCYNKVLEINPNDIKALYNQGIARRELGDVEGSIVSFEKVLQQDKNMLDCYINKGMSYYILQQYKESFNCFKSALDIDNNSIEAYIKMSECLRKMNKSNRGLKLLQKALRINPQSSELYFSIGEIYRETFNIKNALDNYTKAIELNPIYSDAIFQKGVCLQTINELDAAQICFDLCIKFHPSYPKPHINKGQIYEAQGKLKSALRQYEIAVTLKNNTDGDDLALLCKAHSYRERVSEINKINCLQIYQNLITRQNTQPSTKFQAYLGYSAVVIKEIMNNNLKAIGKYIPISQSYTSSVNSSMCSVINNNNNNMNNNQQQSKLNKNQEISNQNIKMDQQDQQIQQLSGGEVEDAYFHLFSLLASEIERLTTFTSSQLEKIQNEQQSDLTLVLILRYLNLKKKQGIGSLGMGNAKHIIFMILSYIFIGLKKREKKEFDQSILYFEFLMNLDKDLELFCRFQSFLSFLQSNYFLVNSKKITFPLSTLITKGNNSEIYEIQFDKESMIQDNFQQQQDEDKSPSNQNKQIFQLSNVSKQLLENFEKELVCRKVKSTQFKNNKEKYLREFALQNILNHRNIQKINYIYFDNEENLYLIEPKQKYNLIQHLSEYIVSFEQRLNILLQISQAVSYLHGNNILHGNISMKNILIRQNDYLPLLTDFQSSKVFLNTYHSSSFQNINQQNGQNSTHIIFQINNNINHPQQSSTSTSFMNPDMKLSLAQDIFALGQVFEHLLIKLDSTDRMINNWYKKSFAVSFSMQKIIRQMLEPNKIYKRPDIQKIVETLQSEIVAAMLYNIYEGPFQSQTSNNNNGGFNQMMNKNLLNNNNKSSKNVLGLQTHNSSANSSGYNTPTINNISALTLLQQKNQQQQHQNILENNQFNNSNIINPGNNQSNQLPIPLTQTTKLSRKQIKKLIPYQQFFNEFDEIRQYSKLVYQLKVVSTPEENKSFKEKVQKIINFSYIYVQDLLNRDLFLNSLSEMNLNFLVIIIKQINDCSSNEQVKLIKDFLEAIKERKKRLETENIYQYSQARLLYRLIGRSDPEKYRYKLMQKVPIKDEYVNIASIFLSDSIEHIENTLRTIFLDALPIHTFQIAKQRLNNFTFAPQFSVQKKKLSIIEKFQEVISCLQIPLNEIDKLIKDSNTNQKLLQILKFDGYLRDLGEGVFELLFKPLRDLIEKQFIYSKNETTSLTDSPNTQIITAKQYYQQKIKSSIHLEKEIEKIKITAQEYLSANIAIKSVANIQQQQAQQNQEPNKKILTTPSPSQIYDNPPHPHRRNLITNKDNKSSPSLITGKMPSIKSLTQFDDIPSNYGQRKSDKKGLILQKNQQSQQQLQTKTQIGQLKEIDEHLENQQDKQVNQQSKNNIILLPKEKSNTNSNYQDELSISAPRSIVNIIVQEANSHLRKLKQYKKQQQQINEENQLSTRNNLPQTGRNNTTTNQQTENTLTQANSNSERKSKISPDLKILTQQKNSISSRANNDSSKITSNNNISAFDEKKSPSKQQQQNNIPSGTTAFTTAGTSTLATQQNLQQQQQQTQNSYLATSHAELLEEEYYNEFVKNHLNQNLFGNENINNSAQRIQTFSQNKIPSSQNYEIQSSLKHIESEDENDNDNDKKQIKTSSKITHSNLSKSQTKIAGITNSGNVNKNQQLPPINNPQPASILRNQVVESIRMKKLNLSGLKSGSSFTSFDKKIVTSSLNNNNKKDKSNYIQTQENDYYNDEDEDNDDDSQNEIKKQFLIKNGVLNAKSSLIDNVYSVEFNDLKALYDNSIDL